ncbi:FMN-binding protein [Candidatus Xianfuyuplasma coldseepsis]|uniref:FMN-binding protein n=1 Tax=Candidatus Xianfuyuplasma coldseepsis TaxID=2782163 RepID=A0A7L7KPU8_9MOLU|nr:FMN-binding protein [Xianfuyuplasma coldseepsis]QMS84282.1 FMN-binding protein [Xianfuyuplasma coldseepsis]
MLDKLKTALVLVVIGAVSGALIFGTNLLTEDRIEENIRNQEFGYYAEMFDLDAIPAEEDVVETPLDGPLEVELELFDGDGNFAGYIYRGSDKNSYGDVTVLVGITTNGTIQQVVISDSSNTPIFVKKIEGDYVTPFIGQDVSNVTYDERTGASFTYGSVEKIVDAAVTYFETNRGGAND